MVERGLRARGHRVTLLSFFPSQKNKFCLLPHLRCAVFVFVDPHLTLEQANAKLH